MDQNPGNIFALVPDECHQTEVIIHPKPHSVSVGVIQVLQPGVLQHGFLGLEEAPEDRPAAAFPVFGVVIELEHLAPGNGSRPISSNDTVTPESLAGRQLDTCSVLLFEIFRDCHSDPDILH